MSAKTGSAHSKYAGLLPIEPSDDFFRPIDLKPEPIDLKPEPIAERIDLKPEDVPFPNWQPSARKRTRSLARFLIAFCAGVAATLLWQSYGDATREMIANLYPPLSPWPALSAENRDVIAPPVASAEQPNAMSFDPDVVGQNVEKIATTIAAGPEPTPDSTDQIATDQEPTLRSTDQTAATETTSIPVESPPDGASLQPTERFGRKPTEARPPKTLSERGKQLSAASRHDASCFASASAVVQNQPGAWPTWTLKAPGHEGIMCWYAAVRPKGSDHRSERMARKETVGPTENGLSAPFAPYWRGGSWEGGLPYGYYRVMPP